MMEKTFLKKYIIIPLVITFLFVAYCTTSVATNDGLEEILVTKIDKSIYEAKNPLAFIPNKKPNLKTTDASNK